MRSTGNARSSLLAAMAIALMGAGREFAQMPMPAPRKGSNRDWNPEPQRKPDNTLAREIAEHNAEVERRKAEKRARKAIKGAA